MFKSYSNKRVFLTGHTGFKGAWLGAWLRATGAETAGFSLPPETEPSMFKAIGAEKNFARSFTGDIRDFSAVRKAIADFRPEIIFHLAAQPIVRRSYRDPSETYTTNVIGTLNVFEAARECADVRALVNITTDKCYENSESGVPFAESDPMGGHDIYSSSKACVEILSASYRKSFLKDGYALATARAGNVIGGGDWAEGRLVPDCVRAFVAGKRVQIRNPKSVRPWQHALEPLSGYLRLGELLLSNGAEYAEAFNFGPDADSFADVESVAEKFVEKFGRGEISFGGGDLLHEAKLLTLDIGKARKRLGWFPTLSLDSAVSDTAEWYAAFYAGADIEKFTLRQIAEFENKLNGKSTPKHS